MSKKSTTKIADDAPVTQADIDSGRLVLPADVLIADYELRRAA